MEDTRGAFRLKTRIPPFVANYENEISGTFYNSCDDSVLISMHIRTMRLYLLL